MPERRGGSRGGGQGGGEFSPAPSPAKLPPLNSADSARGGKSRGRVKTLEPADSGVPETLGPPPSPVVAQGVKRVGRSRSVVGRGKSNAFSEQIVVHLPPHLPCLTVGAGRALLAILIELTNVEILDATAEDDPDVRDA